jgi:chromosome partitioning protein
MTPWSPVLAEYDLVLIDCPPASDLLLINALTAATSAAIVAEPSLFSADGIGEILGTINDVRRHYNPRLSTGGVIFNKVDQQTISGGRWSRSIRNDLSALDVEVLDRRCRRAWRSRIHRK